MLVVISFQVDSLVWLLWRQYVGTPWSLFRASYATSRQGLSLVWLLKSWTSSVAFPIYGMEVLLVTRVWPVLHPLSFVGLTDNFTVVFYACEMISFWLFFCSLARCLFAPYCGYFLLYAFGSTISWQGGWSVLKTMVDMTRFAEANSIFVSIFVFVKGVFLL